MSDILRLGFVDYWSGLDEFFVSTLSKKYQVIRDDVNPDYLIFCDEIFGQKNHEFDNKSNVIKIFYTGENRRFWNYKSHYAITFDHFDDERHYRLPLYVIDHWLMVNNLKMPHINDIVRTPNDLEEKSKFCGFVSGNAVSQKRNTAFQILSQYKKVDSAGPLFNNIGYVLPRGSEAARNKNEWLKPYKFNLCFENSSWPGYCTEKLFHAFYMKTIPIYWGSPTVAMDFNPKAFVNWHDFATEQEFYQKVVDLDNDPAQYAEMFMQPIFSTNRFMDTDRFLTWFQTNVYKGQLK